MKQAARYSSAHIKIPLIHLVINLLFCMTLYIANKYVLSDWPVIVMVKIFLRFRVINRFIRKTYENF